MKFYLFFWSQRIPGLNNDKHVINANPEQEKGKNVVKGTEKETNTGTKPIRDLDELRTTFTGHIRKKLARFFGNGC